VDLNSDRVVFQAGSTHPSFSDVFLILPTSINRLTGLKADPEMILWTCMDAVMGFLHGDVDEVIVRAPRAGQVGRHGNTPATLLYHEKD